MGKREVFHFKMVSISDVCPRNWFLNRRITITLIDSLSNWTVSTLILYFGIFFSKKLLYLATFHKIDEQEEFKKWQPYISKAISIQEEV